MNDAKPEIKPPVVKPKPLPLGMLLAVLALVVAVLPWVLPSLTARFPAAQLWRVESAPNPQLAQLQQEIASLRAAVQAAPPVPDMAIYDVRLNKLEEKLAAVEASLLAADVSMSSAVQIAAAPPAAVLDDKKITLLRLENKLTRGVAFAADLPALQGKIADELYQPLAAAAGGVPTARALAMRLEQQSRMLEAKLAEAQAEGIWARVKASLGGLVQIKKADEVSVAPLAQLGSVVEAEDYARAAEVFYALPDAVRQALAPWWAEVQVRAAATAALQTLFK